MYFPLSILIFIMFLSSCRGVVWCFLSCQSIVYYILCCLVSLVSEWCPVLLTSSSVVCFHVQLLRNFLRLRSSSHNYVEFLTLITIYHIYFLRYEISPIILSIGICAIYPYETYHLLQLMHIPACFLCDVTVLALFLCVRINPLLFRSCASLYLWIVIHKAVYYVLLVLSCIMQCFTFGSTVLFIIMSWICTDTK